MNAPYTCQAILLAHSIGHDGNVIELLRGTVTTADTPDLEFFKIAAFKLQTAHLLAYISHGQQRVITQKGRNTVPVIVAALQSRFGDLPVRELIARLAPDCLAELTAWRAECGPVTQFIQGAK